MLPKVILTILTLIRLGQQVGNLFLLQRHQKDIGTLLKDPISRDSVAIDSTVVYKGKGL